MRDFLCHYRAPVLPPHPPPPTHCSIGWTAALQELVFSNNNNGLLQVRRRKRTHTQVQAASRPNQPSLHMHVFWGGKEEDRVPDRVKSQPWLGIWSIAFSQRERAMRTDLEFNSHKYCLDLSGLHVILCPFTLFRFFFVICKELEITNLIFWYVLFMSEKAAHLHIVKTTCDITHTVFHRAPRFNFPLAWVRINAFGLNDSFSFLRQQHVQKNSRGGSRNENQCKKGFFADCVCMVVVIHWTTWWATNLHFNVHLGSTSCGPIKQLWHSLDWEPLETEEIISPPVTVQPSVVFLLLLACVQPL